MSKKYMLGIDIGTQSIRTHIYDEKANCVAKASVAQYMDVIKSGYATQKPDFWWESVVKNIKEVLTKSEIDPEDIVSVGCCAVMHSPVPVGMDGEVLQKDVQLYCDKRAAHIADELSKDKEASSHYEKTVNPPTSSWFGIKMKWLEENEKEIYNNTFKFLTPKDFINFKLTNKTYIDHSEASGSYLYDSQSDNWSETMIKKLGIDRNKLPEVANSASIIGHISKEASLLTGLKESTVVVCGGGDMLCSLFSSGLSNYGAVVDCTGTGSIITLYSEEPVKDQRIMNLRHVLDGWVPFGCIDSSGGAFRWFRDVLAKKETDLARSRGEDEYSYLEKLASETEYGADGVMFFPYLMGERTLGTPNARAVFIGMNPSTSTGHLVRAILEGIAFEHKRTLEIMEGMGTKICAVYHTGGGAKGNLWSQIKADIYGVPVYTLKNDEGGVLGAALLGGTAVGIYKDLKEAADLVTLVDKEYLPNSGKAERYNYMYRIFCQIHDSLQNSFDDLANRP